jgi:hypothetical protein
MRRISKFYLFGALALNTVAYAEESGETLAKQSQNPVADLISVPFQDNINFGLGPHDRTQNILNIQPVIPLHISKNWNLITRTILPIIHQPTLTQANGSTDGLGDLNATLFLSPRAPSKLIWGLGPVILFPTATDKVLGAGKWGLGPSGVVLTMPGNWVIGAIGNNIWSIGGSDRPPVNQFLLQYFINYNFPKGWYISSAPIITANWMAASKNIWTLPFGGGVGRVFKIGPQPINLGLQGYYNAIKPSNGGDWTLRMQLTFLFPK